MESLLAFHPETATNSRRAWSRTSARVAVGTLAGSMIDPQRDVTRLLRDWGEGDSDALERLIPLVETELRQMARRYMRREARNHTLQPTALVNELYLKLAGQHSVRWENRAQFLGSAARIMRRILVDHARIRDAKKRGSGVRKLSLDEVTEIGEGRQVDLLALDDALDALAKVDERQSRIVELRYFIGLDHREIGEALGISARTVRREWRTARLWLHQAMRLR